MKNARLIRTRFVKQGWWLGMTVAACVWANWDYKGGFGIGNRSAEPDEGFLRTLIGRLSTHALNAFSERLDSSERK